MEKRYQLTSYQIGLVGEAVAHELFGEPPTTRRRGDGGEVASLGPNHKGPFHVWTVTYEHTKERHSGVNYAQPRREYLQ